MNTDIHYRYWTPQHRQALREAGSSLSEMLRVALDVTAIMPSGLHLVSGPITTGGMGNMRDNIRVFRRAIKLLAEREQLNIFSQMPFEDGMVAFHEQWARTANAHEYCWPILLEFYKPLFAARKFATFHFIHGYEHSVGAQWEHDQAVELGFNVRYLTEEFSRECSAVLKPA